MNKQEEPTAETTLSAACSGARVCAMVFADLRFSEIMDVSDLLGAMCLVNYDRLAKYWDDPDGFRRFIIAQPETRAAAQQIESLGWRVLVTRKVESGRATKLVSPDFQKVHLAAKRLARLGPAPPAGMGAIVFPEHYLLAITEQQDLDIARRLLGSGLRVDALRRDVQNGIS